MTQQGTVYIVPLNNKLKPTTTPTIEDKNMQSQQNQNFEFNQPICQDCLPATMTLKLHIEIIVGSRYLWYQEKHKISSVLSFPCVS
jgi:hypothetical protein